MKVCIIGCGDVGLRCAQKLRNQHQITAARRNIDSLPDWLTARPADVANRDSLHWLQYAAPDVLIYSLAAASFQDRDYQLAYVTGLANTLAALGSASAQLKRLIFVSSTGVYHQNDGSVVDENSDTAPTRFNGQRMLEAETLALASGKGTCVRFSGIYGPGRLRMVNRVASGNFTASNRDALSNRIHVDDCAGVLAHIVARVADGSVESCYLASDNRPALTSEVESFIAAELGLRYQPPSDPDAAPAGGRIAGSKRCSNQRLIASGYRFKYADFEAGYRALLSTL